MQPASDSEPGAIVPVNQSETSQVVARPGTVSPVESGIERAPSTQARRLSILIGAGAAVFAVAYTLAPRGDDGAGVELSGTTASRAAAAPRAKQAPVSLTTPSRTEVPLQAAADPFVAVSFVPPPPPPPPVVPPPPPPPPPPPKAPPLPFSFVGLLEKGGPKPAAFLARGDALLVVSAGDVVDKDYRIESLSESEIVVIYLPLNERQSLTATGGRP
jgi:hypothetical protein